MNKPECIFVRSLSQKQYLRIKSQIHTYRSPVLSPLNRDETQIAFFFLHTSSVAVFLETYPFNHYPNIDRKIILETDSQTHYCKQQKFFPTCMWMQTKVSGVLPVPVFVFLSLFFCHNAMCRQEQSVLHQHYTFHTLPHSPMQQNRF